MTSRKVKVGFSVDVVTHDKLRALGFALGTPQSKLVDLAVRKLEEDLSPRQRRAYENARAAECGGAGVAR